MNRSIRTWLGTAILLMLLPASALAQDISFEPDFGPMSYRGRRAGGSGAGQIFVSFSFGEGVYFHYNCGALGCDSTTVAPADFELLAGYRLGRHWQLDLGLVWAMDFDHYGDRTTSVVGVRPGIRLLLPGHFRRIWYLRAAVPILKGISGENNDLLIGFMLGVGLELRFRVIGLFAELNFSPYFVEVADNYYVIPAQGRLGLSFRF